MINEIFTKLTSYWVSQLAVWNFLRWMRRTLMRCGHLKFVTPDMAHRWIHFPNLLLIHVADMTDFQNSKFANI